MADIQLPPAKPFFKWAGSKRWLVPHIQKYLPKQFNRYYEPFLGSGALFFSLRPEQAQLSDINKNIIDTYIALRDEPEKIIRKLKSMPYEKRYYYWVRDVYKPRSAHGKAARIIYLNRTCWNGLYRENSSGKFNVPMGRFENPRICDAENLMAVSHTIRNVKFEVCDFEEAVKDAREGDFIFFDPPYITGHRNNGFHAYNEKLFKWEDQVRLAVISSMLHSKGCYVLITNAADKLIKALYKEFSINIMSRNSVIAANIGNRRLVDELLITTHISALRSK